MSLGARVVEKLLNAINIKDGVKRSGKTLFRYNKYSKPPKSFYKRYTINQCEIKGHNYFSIKNSQNPKIHIIYLHGGAYKNQAIFLHWNFMNKFLKSLDCTVTFIDYPLAPEHTCIETVDMVESAYKHIFNNNSDQKIIIVGDSAGGGLALVLAQKIKLDGIFPKPAKLILISPWLDVSMSHSISSELLSSDLMLNLDILIEDGKIYAGSLDTKDPLCSPLYGDSKDIGKIALFIGTKEIIYVDALQYRAKAKKFKYDLSFYEYKGMQHDFALFPLKEAKTAFCEMIDFIIN